MSMAKNKFYGIKNGVNPTTGEPVTGLILNKSWGEVEPYIKGVSGAVYKGFKTESEAKEYIGITQARKLTKSNALRCYVDGSFNNSIPNYSYGLVCVKNGKVVHTDQGEGKNAEAVSMRQIAGELLGAMQALSYAKRQNFKEVVIVHDYLGIRNHATGEWGRKNEFSKTYYAWMTKFFKDNPSIKVTFEKVDAHTGDDFNEMADGYAKLAVRIEPDPIFYRMVEKHQLGV